MPVLLLLFRGCFPGMVGNSNNRANSAQFQVKLPTGAELGNIFGSEEKIDRKACEAELNKSGTVSECGNVKQSSKD